MPHSTHTHSVGKKIKPGKPYIPCKGASQAAPVVATVARVYSRTFHVDGRRFWFGSRQVPRYMVEVPAYIHFHNTCGG